MTSSSKDRTAGSHPPVRRAQNAAVPSPAVPPEAASPRGAGGTAGASPNAPVQEAPRHPSSPSPPLCEGDGSRGAREEGPGIVSRTGAGLAPAESPPGSARPHAALPGGSTWTIELPAGLELLSLNGREHYYARHRLYQSLKQAAWAMVLKAKLPRLQRVTVTVVYDPPDRRHRDADNLAPTLKALVDGLVASGRIGAGVPLRPGQGDDSRYVAAVTMEIGPEPYPRGRLRLIICEVAP